MYVFRYQVDDQAVKAAFFISLQPHILKKGSQSCKSYIASFIYLFKCRATDDDKWRNCEIKWSWIKLTVKFFGIKEASVRTASFQPSIKNMLICTYLHSAYPFPPRANCDACPALALRKKKGSKWERKNHLHLTRLLIEKCTNVSITVTPGTHTVIS